jgi:hypothetical protein
MRSLRTLLVVLPLLLLGCGGDDGGSGAAPADVATDDSATGDDDTTGAEPADDAAPPSGSASGRVTTDKGTVDFDATTCVIYDDEAEVSGPGTWVDGTVAFFDISASLGYGSLQITVGTDQWSESGDEIFNVHEFDSSDISGSTFTASGELNYEQGSPSGRADVEVSCG